MHRWPRALPQLEVGHLGRIAMARSLLSRRPGVVLAGASCDGIGVAACITSGNQAATDALAHLSSSLEPTP